MKTKAATPIDLNLPGHVGSWEEYFLLIAATVAAKSKDPNCRVGAVVVSPDNVVLSTGFNGLARQVYDDARLLADPDEKLKLICHAEMNAIFNAARVGVALKDATIFVTKFPCLACCNAIIQVGITRIYTHDSKFWDRDPVDSKHTRKLEALRQAHVRVEAPFHSKFAPTQPIGVKKEEKAVLRKAPSKSRQAKPTSRAGDLDQPDLFDRRR